LSDNKKKVCLIGAAGRMGKSITQVLSYSSTLQLGSAIEREDSIYLGLDSGLHSNTKENQILYSANRERGIAESAVIIDFSSHTETLPILERAAFYKKPVVIGATGHTVEETLKIKEFSQKIPLIYSPNMSVGVNLLLKLIELAAPVLGDHFDIELLDIHHRHKKDSPSGTAMALKNVLLKALQRDESHVIYGRHGMYGERDPKQIAVHTMRAGEVIGEHTVYFTSPEERIEISHRAEDRKTFAVGAVKAADFLVLQKIGLYTMFDVLGL
jgi:4-hydroxy-tetrahydrodipicolinate reductase